ncbi:hypothetical protein ACFL2B_01055 [Patescibacteria group bacterium]
MKKRIILVLCACATLCMTGLIIWKACGWEISKDSIMFYTCTVFPGISSIAVLVYLYQRIKRWTYSIPDYCELCGSPIRTFAGDPVCIECGVENRVQLNT